MSSKVTTNIGQNVLAAVVFQTILLVRSERWYSATAVERETPKIIYYGPPKVHLNDIRGNHLVPIPGLPKVNLYSRNRTRAPWKFMEKHDLTPVPIRPSQPVRLPNVMMKHDLTPVPIRPSQPVRLQNVMMKNVTFEYIVKKNTPTTPAVEPVVTSESDWSSQQDWSTMIPSLHATKISQLTKNVDSLDHDPKELVLNMSTVPLKDSLVTFGYKPQGSNGKYDSLTHIKSQQHSFNTIPKRKTDFKFNNTLYNINIWQKSKLKSKPKRRVVQRCPSNFKKTRQKKQLEDQVARKRFLEVFEVVEFDHVACTSSSGLEGICLPELECASPAKAMGSCADGYGVCCVNQFSCDDHTASPSGWFTNPGFPSPSSERLSCTLTLKKAWPDVKQIRLDFTNFELLPPIAGTCEQDQFVVSGQNINNIVPILCGVNTGQHMYIEVGDVEGPLIVTVQTVSAENRLFSIKFTQISWADDLAAPPGCLQYHKGPRGFLESFNYADKSAISIPRIPSYLNNLNYAMCIEREPGACTMTYTNTDVMQIVNFDGDGLPVIPPGQAGVEVLNCPTDWLLMAAVRLCGDRLNDGAVLQDFALDAPVTEIAAGPMIVWFRSDGGYAGRGFRLQYQQNNC